MKYLILAMFFAIVNCTEPFELKSNDFEDLLVVEATITNELKNHTVRLTRTKPLGETTERYETSATVKITSNTGLVYHFTENSNIYTSDDAFQIEPNIEYTLNITTANGKQYVSTSEKLPTQTEIESVNAIQKNENGILGVSINVSSFDATNTSKFYRYEFEETYKIIAPKWSPSKIEFDPISDAITISPNTSNNRVCYANNLSNLINLYTTENLSEDRVQNHEVNFLNKTNPKITNRYSILVKQYILNPLAYNYYKTLKNISQTDNVLSQVQTGFVIGNLSCITNKDEKVIGYFDISSISKKRLFFNFDDIFASEESQAYFFNDCSILYYLSNIEFLTGDEDFNYAGARALLRNAVNNNDLTYLQGSDGNEFQMTYRVCGDCTTIGSNIVPSFWVD